MPPELPTCVEQATPAWLTHVLTDSGALTSGTVVGVEVNPGQGNWSTSARLTLSYAPDARGDLPRRLFLKLVQADLGDESFGPSEVLYYTHDYAGIANAPLLRCYSAAFSAEHQRYYLLLDDVSDTHIQASAKAPTLEFGLALAEGLAALHGLWWGERRLAQAAAPVHSAEHIQRFVAIAEPGVEPILSHFSSELRPHWPKTIQALFVKHPEQLIARTQDASGFTLIHGDVGETNILVPRTGDRPIYIIDRQPFDWSLTTWLGAYDLAYAMVLDWPVETRRRLELPVLQHYLACLQRHGIVNYGWDKLFEDYRLSVATCVYVAVEYCRGGVNERSVPVWLPMLKRALTACDDLDCAAPRPAMAESG